MTTSSPKNCSAVSHPSLPHTAPGTYPMSVVTNGITPRNTSRIYSSASAIETDTDRLCSIVVMHCTPADPAVDLKLPNANEVAPFNRSGNIDTPPVDATPPIKQNNDVLTYSCCGIEQKWKCITDVSSQQLCITSAWVSRHKSCSSGDTILFINNNINNNNREGIPYVRTSQVGEPQDLSSHYKLH